MSFPVRVQGPDTPRRPRPTSKSPSKSGRTANQDRVAKGKKGAKDSKKRREAWKKELLKIRPQKRRAKGVSREDHRKWKDEQKAKHRKKVRSMFPKDKK